MTATWLHDEAEKKRAYTRKCEALALWRDEQLKPHWDRYQNIEHSARADYDELSGIPIGWEGPVDMTVTGKRAWAEYQRVTAEAYSTYRRHQQRIDAQWKHKLAKVKR